MSFEVRTASLARTATAPGWTRDDLFREARTLGLRPTHGLDKERLP
jgi:hypothetical protein